MHTRVYCNAYTLLGTQTHKSASSTGNHAAQVKHSRKPLSISNHEAKKSNMTITESCHAHECVMAHIWSSYVTHVGKHGAKQSKTTKLSGLEGQPAAPFGGQTFGIIRVTWLTCVRGVTHSCMWHDALWPDLGSVLPALLWAYVNVFVMSTCLSSQRVCVHVSRWLCV